MPRIDLIYVMKLWGFFAFLILLVLLATPSRGAPTEVRGLWVVRATLTSCEKIAEMVRRAKDAGINTLIVQVRGRGDAWYRSRWDPRAEELKDAPESFDPLEVTVREAHTAGLKVHAWINAGFTAGVDGLPSSADHIVILSCINIVHDSDRTLGRNPKVPPPDRHSRVGSPRLHGSRTLVRLHTAHIRTKYRQGCITDIPNGSQCTRAWPHNS